MKTNQHSKADKSLSWLTLSLLLILAGYASSLEWEIEVVDTTGGTGNHTSLALDISGFAHVSYYDTFGGDLRYARESGAGWDIQVVDSLGDVGMYTSIVLDGSGYPRISYYNTTNGDLKYAYKNASGWHTETVDEYGDVGRYTSLALDGSDYPHISYYDAMNQDLRYARDDGSGWQIETVDSLEDVGSCTSLALDASGLAHISYMGVGVKYAQNSPSGWLIETADPAGTHYTSMALDAAGFPHIGYCGPGGFVEGLYIAKKDASSGWHIQILGAAYTVGSPSLALDADEHPHIVSIAGDPRWDYLGYERWDGSGWQEEVVDGPSYFGGGNRILAIDESGYPRICYCGGWPDVYLKYASGFPASIVLSGEMIGGELMLSWSPVADASAYWVYGASNQVYFVPGFSPGYQHRLAVLPAATATWSSANGVGDPAANWTYLVLAVDATEQELCRSNSVGEHDFTIAVP